MQRKAPLPGRIFARCILRRRFAGHFGCMARRSCQSQPVFGCMARESCRELAIFPSEATFGMHGAQNLPRIDAQERTAREYCHCQSGQEHIRAQSCHRRTLGSAFREHFAIGERPGTHCARILPLPVARERIREDLAMDERLDSPRTKQLPLSPQKNGAEGRTWRTSPRQKHEAQSAGAAGASSGYGAVQRHRRTLGNTARRNIAMADNAPRDKGRRAFCSPSFAVLFTARVAIGAFAVGSRRHLAVSLIEAHIR